MLSIVSLFLMCPVVLALLALRRMSRGEPNSKGLLLISSGLMNVLLMTYILSLWPA